MNSTWPARNDEIDRILCGLLYRAYIYCFYIFLFYASIYPCYTPYILPLLYRVCLQEHGPPANRNTGTQEHREAGNTGRRKIGRNEKEVNGKNYVYRNHRPTRNTGTTGNIGNIGATRNTGSKGITGATNCTRLYLYPLSVLFPLYGD